MRVKYKYMEPDLNDNIHTFICISEITDVYMDEIENDIHITNNAEGLDLVSTTANIDSTKFNIITSTLMNTGYYDFIGICDFVTKET